MARSTQGDDDEDRVSKYELGGKRKREANESQTNHDWFLMTFNGKFIISVTVVISIYLGGTTEIQWGTIVIFL